MAGIPVDIGTGTIVAFTTTAYAAELLSVSWSGISRPSVETTHIGTAAATGGSTNFGNGTFVPGDIVDPGELTLEYNFDPDKTIAGMHTSALDTITVTFPLYAGDATAAKWTATGFWTAFEVNVPHEDRMTATATIKLSGAVAYTAAA